MGRSCPGSPRSRTTGEPAARRSYAAGLEGRVGRETSFRLEGSIQEMDEVVRAFFEGDFLTDFDSIYLLDGNTLRQYQASGRHRLSRAVAGTLGVRYGDIGGGVSPATASSYGISDSSGRFWSARAAIEILPTRTGVAFLVRGVRQKLDSTGAVRANDSDKVALSVAQDLSIVGLTPFGSICKLLVALESSRSTASTEREDPPVSSRVLGGVALSFLGTPGAPSSFLPSLPLENSTQPFQKTLDCIQFFGYRAAQAFPHGQLSGCPY